MGDKTKTAKPNQVIVTISCTDAQHSHHLADDWRTNYDRNAAALLPLLPPGSKYNCHIIEVSKSGTRHLRVYFDVY